MDPLSCMCAFTQKDESRMQYKFIKIEKIVFALTQELHLSTKYAGQKGNMGQVDGKKMSQNHHKT